MARLAINNTLDFNKASWDVGGPFGWLNRRGNRSVVSRRGRCVNRGRSRGMRMVMVVVMARGGYWHWVVTVIWPWCRSGAAVVCSRLEGIEGAAKQEDNDSTGSDRSHLEYEA